MNKEEKAKAYDEAIKKAKKDLQVCEQDCLVAKQIFRYFPELAESDDEKTRKVLVDYFKRYKEQEECGINTFYGIATDNILAWLEKQKPIQNINKEDEEVRQYIIRTMKQKDINVPMVQKALAWLEKQGKQKPAWSEEDEEFLRRAINATKDAYPVTANWLKSLKERYTWKPSEEQMEALFVLLPTVSYGKNPAFSLYNDLEKLKGE